MQQASTKLLLVDDDPGILRLLARWLAKAGYQVRCAQDGAEALTLIEQDPPDLLITDWEMPRVDGLELCRRLRQMDLPHFIYVIFLSARSAPNESVVALEVGANDFVAKPVHYGELLARVRAGMRMLALERRLSQLASTDPLTGLMTQRSFYESLAKEWQRTLRYRLPLSCVMLDLDFFKRINDSYGHPAGDTVLKLVAGTLAESCRGSDILCRYGGEEFCVLLPETSGEQATQWAERVRQRISGLSVTLGSETLRISASFGSAERHEDTQTPSQLVDQADQALLCAKHSGRDRVARFEALTDANNVPSASDHAGQALLGVTAAEVMAPLVAWIRAEETVGTAVDLFLRTRVNSMPVVDAEGKLIGIVSEKDIMATVPSLGEWGQPIRAVMRPNVICYGEGTPLRVIYDFLCRVSIRRIVVVAPDRRPVGTISRSTLLRWFRDLVLARYEGSEDTVPAKRVSTDSLGQRLDALAALVADLQKYVARDSGPATFGLLGRLSHLEQSVQGLLLSSEAALAGDQPLTSRQLTPVVRNA